MKGLVGRLVSKCIENKFVWDMSSEKVGHTFVKTLCQCKKIKSGSKTNKRCKKHGCKNRNNSENV